MHEEVCSSGNGIGSLFADTLYHAVEKVIGW